VTCRGGSIGGTYRVGGSTGVCAIDIGGVIGSGVVI